MPFDPRDPAQREELKRLSAHAPDVTLPHTMADGSRSADMPDDEEVIGVYLATAGQVRFVAAAREAVPALLEEVERLQRFDVDARTEDGWVQLCDANARLRALVDELSEKCNAFESELRCGMTSSEREARLQAEIERLTEELRKAKAGGMPTWPPTKG